MFHPLHYDTRSLTPLQKRGRLPLGCPPSKCACLVFPIHKSDLHRYVILLTRLSPKPVHKISLLAVIQNIILFLLGVPTHTAVQQPHSGLAPSDILCGALSLITLAIEFIADNQQYSFQKFKHHGLKYNGNEWIGARLRWIEDDAKRGFVTRGLWAWSRHPNFLCEQTFWVSSPFFLLFIHSLLPRSS